MSTPVVARSFELLIPDPQPGQEGDQSPLGLGEVFAKCRDRGIRLSLWEAPGAMDGELPRLMAQLPPGVWLADELAASLATLKPLIVLHILVKRCDADRLGRLWPEVASRMNIGGQKPKERARVAVSA